MIYTLINENGTCGGTIGIKPEHDNWTETPYFGGFVKEFWNGTDWVEGATKEEIDEFNANYNNELDIKYTKLISELVEKYVQKLATRQIPIPKEILEEQQRLINEYKQLIR